MEVFMKILKNFKIVLFVSVIFFLTSCRLSEIDYNGEILYSWFNYNEIIKKDFYENNKIKNGMYDPIEYDPDIIDSEYYYQDIMAPSRRLILVDTLIEAESIFTNKVDVDFEDEMLLIYIFADSNSLYKLESIHFNNDLLEIKFDTDNIVSTAPEETFIIFKMDKLTFKDVVINKQLFVDAYNGGHHHEFIDNKCSCGLVLNKAFYSLEDAYNNKWLTKSELEWTAEYYKMIDNIDHVTLHKTLKDEILTCFINEYRLDVGLNDLTINCLYIYEESLAIIIDCPLFDNTTLENQEIIDGVIFNYDSLNHILVYKPN